MDILRKGAWRDRGTTTIVSGLSFKTGNKYSWQDNVNWDSRTKHLIIRPRNVPSTDGVTQHDYFIRLTLDDISSLISLLGHVGSATDAKLLRDHLGKHVPAIVKLLACATGVNPMPMYDESQSPSS